MLYLIIDQRLNKEQFIKSREITLTKAQFARGRDRPDRNAALVCDRVKVGQEEHKEELTDPNWRQEWF